MSAAFTNGRKMIRSAVATMLLAWLAAWTGCGEIEWMWSEGPARPIRPAGKPIASAPPSTQPSETTTAAPPPPTPTLPPTAASPAPASPTPPVSTAPASQVAGAEEPAFYQLVLLSEAPGEPTPPGLQHVQLARAPAQAVGELLGDLFIPAGPTGTLHRYTLVYPSSLECQAATEAAHDLDVPPVGEGAAAPPEDVAAAFAFAVGLIHGTPRGHADEADRLQSAETCLIRILNAPDEPARRRWAAGMIAGAVQADRLNDTDKAAVCFSQAAAAAEPGSLEKFTARYTWARACIQNGKTDLARETLSDLITSFDAFKTTEVFKRAGDTLAELERKRTR